MRNRVLIGGPIEAHRSQEDLQAQKKRSHDWEWWMWTLFIAGCFVFIIAMEFVNLPDGWRQAVQNFFRWR